MPTQKVLWIQEDRNIDRIKIRVDRGTELILEDRAMSWQRLRELCYPLKGLGSGLHMIIDSRWSLPITPHKSLIPDEILSKLTDYTETFRGAFNATKNMSAKDRAKARQSDYLLICLMIAIIGAFIFWGLTSKIDFKAWGY